MNSANEMLLQPSTIALAQIAPVLGDIKRNVELHAAWCERAIECSATAIIFPELSLTGYTLRDLNFECALRMDMEVLAPLKKLSKKITIIAGAVEADARGAVYNAALLFENGEVKHTHRKVYPPTYGIFEEGRYFSSGREANAFTSDRMGRIGLMVCEDLWHPALPYLEALDGAQLIITIAASPTRLGSGEEAAHSSVPENYTINREHHAAYARLLGCFVVFVNRVGVEDGVNFWGGSEAVAPSGETIARGKFFEEDFVIAEIDPAQVRQARQRSRHFLDDDPLLTQHLLARVIGMEVVPIAPDAATR
ncbi:MAG TPA: nitrilase-related carbon-nitrogen hydrolase [Candidatus Kapabacteria bacterium]|nr:nitrilase-related carbon-nitrogen hydrolase [Candidatus Kapabacteria bacterium]